MAPNSISTEAGPSGTCPSSRDMKKIGGKDCDEIFKKISKINNVKCSKALNVIKTE